MKVCRIIILSLIFSLIFPSAFAFAQEHEHDFDTFSIEDDSIYSLCSDCGEERHGFDTFLSGNWVYTEGEEVYYITLKEGYGFQAHLQDGDFSGEWDAELYALNEEDETMALELYFYEKIGDDQYEQFPINLIIMEIKFNGPTAKSVMFGFDYFFRTYNFMTDEQLAEFDQDIENIEELVASKWVSERIVTYGSTEGEFPESEDTDHSFTLNADGTFFGTGPTCGDISGTWTMRNMARHAGITSINLDLQCAERPDISVISMNRSETEERLTLMSFGGTSDFCTGYFVLAE